MCRIGIRNCFSFFSCKDDGDRLMKRASFSCIFVCVVCCCLLEVSPVLLVVLAIRLALLSHCDTHTHTHTHTNKHTHTRTQTNSRTHKQTHTPVFVEDDFDIWKEIKVASCTSSLFHLISSWKIISPLCNAGRYFPFFVPSFPVVFLSLWKKMRYWTKFSRNIQGELSMCRII